MTQGNIHFFFWLHLLLMLLWKPSERSLLSITNTLSSELSLTYTYFCVLLFWWSGNGRCETFYLRHIIIIRVCLVQRSPRSNQGICVQKPMIYPHSTWPFLGWVFGHNSTPLILKVQLVNLPCCNELSLRTYLSTVHVLMTFWSVV